MTRLKNAARWLLIFQLTFGTLSPRNTMTHAAEPEEIGEAASVAAQGAGDEREGLRFRLSEGAEESEASRPSAAASNVAPAEKLSEAETLKVLQRLPPIKVEAGDEQDFALREKSLPPPRTGRTVLAAFPAPAEREAPDAAATGPFEVVRYSPTGEVPLAPQLSVTFSQPMVAVTSQDEAARVVPVRLSPQVPGRWRWLGTKTLIFDPAAERLPMATEFTVSVDASARSASGGAPKAAASWKFSTPAPQLKTKYPEGGPVRRDAIMFAEFDQKIDPAAVLRTVSVRGGAAATGLKLRLATDDEIAADSNVSRLAKAAVKERWLAFRAVDAGGGTATALPQAAGVSVTFGPGTPSAEGPRVTAKAQSFSFRTFGPLRVTRHQCGWQKTCTPFDQWQITFSNPLDRDAFDAKQLRFSPELPDPKIQIYGNTLYVQGMKKGRTTYRMTLPAALRDEFGQTLGEDVTLNFTVGSAPPNLFSQGGHLIVLDPSARQPTYSIYSVNHPSLKVSLYAVRPEDWERFNAYMRAENGYSGGGRETQPKPPGRLVSSRVVKVAGQPDELTETRVDLAPALENNLGQVVVVVEQTIPPVMRQQKQKGHAWVQVTGIGLDAMVDRAELVGWATSLKDGQPLAGVEMRLHDGGGAGVSGADGMARLALPPKSSATTGLLVARRGAEVAILPERAEWWGTENGWVRREAADALSWYVFDDRKMYRPGEEVSVKGWIRRVGGGETGDVGALAGAVESVSYAVRDARGNELTKGAAQLNALGGFDLKFKLPGTLNLGGASLQLDAVGGTSSVKRRQHTHQFQVQEFRRPEFEVTAKASEGPHFVGAHAQATVSASYFAGGGLPNSEVLWRVTALPGHFTPPNRDEYTFGKWVPWWGGGRYGRPGAASRTETFGGRTDAAGNHRLRIDFEGVRPPQASSVTAQASVTDVNRQTWTATTTMLVHPADLYVGIRSDRTFVRQGEPLVVHSIVTDLDGRAVAGREVKMRAVLLDWTYTKGEWRQTEADAQECSVRSASDAVKCTFTPKKGGMYRVTARVLDDRERPNESELTLWVAGGKQPPRRGVEQESVELIPDRKEYRAGETAEVLVQTPFFPAEGVLTLRRSGLVRTEHFRMDGPSHTLRIPIEEAFTPNVYAHVNLVGAAARADDAGVANEKLPKRPAFAEGELNLSVPPLARRLQVTATPKDKALEPGGETTVNIEVKDAAGRAVRGSELAVVVVDESVLALTGYRLEDPASFFYAQRGAEVRDHHLRANVLLEDPTRIDERQVQELPLSGRGVGANFGLTGGGRNMNASSEPPPPPSPVARMARREKMADGAMLEAEEDAAGGEIRLRADFNALAVFAPSVLTDADGRAEVKVKVPDNLTRYRVMAVSVAGGKQFGKGESSITARMPLMVRPSAPRFLNFGDRFELPVVLQNQTDRPLEVNVAVRATNAELSDGAGRRVTVPANNRVEVRFPTNASMAGTARFQLAAASGRHSDAAEVSLPVWTPATTEAFATYGELDASGGALVQPFQAPPGVFPQFGGLEVTTSSTQLQALTDAVLYLVAYPYECSEQLSSRILAVAALRDVLTAFRAEEMPPPEELRAFVERDLAAL
ncbi:MAG TPA: alpha-2-macroglobulin family protein, partial [Pyrinomonadaceae bacterium]|nr:alpha-2-macroglobulin family protein [Pyrinomonadaceae bacterium]